MTPLLKLGRIMPETQMLYAPIRSEALDAKYLTPAVLQRVKSLSDTEKSPDQPSDRGWDEFQHALPNDHIGLVPDRQ